jgi:hypothetical protein
MPEPEGQQTPPVTPPVTPPGQSAPQDWRPEELRGEKTLEKFKDPGSLAKSYIELEKRLGTAINVPKEDAKPEEWEAFYRKIGKPEKVEEYGVTKPEDMPPGVSWNDELTQNFLTWAHTAGLNKTQVKTIINAWNQQEGAKAHAMTKEIGAQIAKLKESSGDQFTGRIELGIRGIEKLMPGEDGIKFKELMDSTGLGNHPLILKYAYAVGNMLKEDGYILGDGSGGAMSRDNIKSKIDAINGDPKHAYWDETHPNHKAAVEEMSMLFKSLGR